MKPQSLNDYDHNSYITKTYERIYNPTHINKLGMLNLKSLCLIYRIKLLNI